MSTDEEIEPLDYTTRPVGMKQPRLEGRLVLTPEIDLARYTCRAVIDWVWLEFETQDPTQSFPLSNYLKGALGRRHKVTGPGVPHDANGHRKAFEIGPFHITPFLIDHSAFDSHAFLVEAGGRRLFYSGDLRAHGRKGWSFSELVARPPAAVDALLLEGTTISRSSRGQSKSERDLEGEIVADLGNTRGIALAWFSGQNIDRFVTFFRAALRTSRTMVIDPYVGHLLLAVARNTLPDPRSSELRVFLPATMKRRIMRERSFELVEPFRSRRIFPEELASRAPELLMAFRPSMCLDFEKIRALSGAKLIYSLWPGYLDRAGSDIRGWCLANGVEFVMRHVSGHADIPTLRRLADAIAPGRIIPIHTDAAAQFHEVFREHDVELRRNGEWWDV